jgi:small subunit ribosomal protein S6
MSVAPGTCGASEASFGQATTSASTAATAAARPTFPQRTRRSSSRSMSAIGPRAGRFAPALLASTAAMATEAPLYDLTLLLESGMEAERRDQILANVEHAIEASGEIVGRHEWGVRATAYEVRKHTDADYHLVQFHGDRTLLEQLDHNLKITDGILRHRIIKLRPGTPPPPDLSAAAAATVPAGDPAEA